MFDLSMFPTVTRVTRKTTADLKGNSFKNNVVTRVTRKNACGLQENLNKNNVVTRVTDVTRKNNNVRNNIDAEQEAFEERAAIMEHDGGLSRSAAEAQARVICLAEFRQRKQRQ